MNRNQLLQAIIALTNKRVTLHINDPAINIYWEKYTALLTQDMDDTKWVLEHMKEEQLYWVSEVFEDLSMHFQSKAFIQLLQQLQKKNPKAITATDIVVAQYMLNE